jgi:periplasmic divalent cation tolerance protein
LLLHRTLLKLILEMKESKYRMVWVTAPDLETARRLAKGAVERRLAACGKVLSLVESHYWWEGKLESANEYQLVFKTHQDRLQSLTDWVVEQHPYEVPECVAVPVVEGYPPYLNWLRSETEACGSDRSV